MKTRAEIKSNPITTITGIVLAIVTILGALGYLSPTESTEVQTQAGVILSAASQIIAAVSAIILVFKARD